MEETRVGNCRFYENKYPEVDDLVMVKVQSIAEMGAYVTLLEYNNIEGMILLSELSRRRIRSISKLIRVGRTEVVVVLRVDKEKGYIDLSKRRVSPEDMTKCEERFNKSKAVHSILRNVAENEGMELEELYRQVGWPLYKKYGHAFDAFKMALGTSDPYGIFEGVEVDEEVKKMLVENIQKRLKPQPVKIRADIQVTCFGYDGIDAVKEALRKGEQIGTQDIPIKIKLVAPPLYVVNSTCFDKQRGIELLEKSLEIITTEIIQRKGNIVVSAKPRAVSAHDDSALAALMDKLDQQNKEVDGDLDTDEEGEGEASGSEGSESEEAEGDSDNE